MENYLIARATDVGVARKVNEDCLTVFDSPNGRVMAVCDGMGGQAAGDVASQLSVNIIENILTDNTFATPEEAIRSSILAANQGVLNRTAQSPELDGMGSTCVMLIIKDGRVHCGWVGDSRIYYISNHTIRQISHDQSYVQQLLDSGQITPAEAINHPQKNEITNCIGLQGMTPPDTVAVPIVPEPGSIFLLCSDGLSSMVDDRQIERVLSNSKLTLQEKADRLIAMANEAGGLDNITVELVQFGEPGVSGATSGTLFETPEGAKKGRMKSRNIIYSAIGVILLASACGIGSYTYIKWQKEKQKNETPAAKPVQQTGTSGTSTTDTTSSTSTGTPNQPTQNTNNTQGKSGVTSPQEALSGGSNNGSGSSIPKVIGGKKPSKNTKDIVEKNTETEEQKAAREEMEKRQEEEEERLKKEIINKE